MLKGRKLLKINLLVSIILVFGFDYNFIFEL